jgi:hypothetical protein
MPRTVRPLLRQLYERLNPNVCEFVEVAQPDVGQVLRRWTDQLGPSTPRVSETPVSTTQSSPGGGLMLKATPTQLANFYTLSGTRIFLEVPDQSRIIEGVGWSLPSAADFRPVRLKSVKVSLHVTSVQVTQFELQIYRMRGVPGRVVNAAGFPTSGQLIQYTPTPLLSQPARVAFGALTAPNDFDVTFELSQYQLDIEHRNVPAPSLLTAGEIPEYIFEVSLTGTAGNDQYQWNLDTATTRTIAGVGVFRHAKWQKQKPVGTPAPDPGDPLAQWVDIGIATNVPAIQINVDTYPATSQEVYTITLPRVPSTPSTGRIVFRREVPLDTSATLEISTTGSGGTYTAVTDGTVIATKQTTYHLRSTMNASADTHRSPEIEALGIEFATAIDVTAEATVEGIPQDINLPFLDAAIGEGRITIVRTGKRDYRDPASDLLTATAATQLIVDHYLGSRHPSVTRDQWLHLGRYIVTSAQPLPTSEILSVISYLKVAKRKVPQRAETVNAVLTTVSGTTATALKVTGPLPGTTVGDEYDAQNYYVRIVSTAVVGLAPGMLFPVSGNTGTTQIDLTAPGMPAALAIGDTFELHSATYQQPKLSWVNADPADVWYEVWTVLLGVPAEKIGRSDMGRAGRSGLPPKLADREPDSTAGGPRDKLRVSRTITDQSEGLTLIDELSFHMGGSTVEIGGQIVFRQIYDVLDQFGNLVIPAEEVAATFDVREIATLDTPRGLESRITTIECTYGVDTALGQDAAKPSRVVFSDADAVAWFTQQDLEEIGNSEIPEGIAAWCYNTYDSGQYLASKLCEQIVRIGSTGLRQWSFTVTDMHPDLCVGDRVVVQTDQYTDYDPTRKVAVRGLWAFTIVLTHVARMGRELRGFVPGLFSGVPVRGGSGGVSTGLVAQPSIGNIDFNAAGELLVTVNQGTPPGGGFRLAASTAGMPSDATVDAASFTPGPTATVNLGGGWTAGAQVQIKVIAYASAAVNGAKSLPSTGHATVTGGSATIFIDTLAQGSPNYAANTVPLSWAGHGVIASYDVWVSESLDGGGASFVLAQAGATSPYTFTSSYDIATSGTHTVTLAFYVVGKNGGGAVIATSPTNSHTYIAKGI